MMATDHTPDLTHSSDDDDVVPIPPRFWWLKRIVVVTAIVVVALAGLRIWWAWDTKRRLRSAIDARIALNEPIYPADFNPTETIPDAENAAKLLLQASAAVNVAYERRELLRDFPTEPARIENHPDAIAAIIEANARSLDLAHKARSVENADWGVRVKSPAINTLLPNLSGQRELSKLLGLAAGHQHAVGRDDDAIETLNDLLAHAAKLDHHTTLIGHLVATSVCAVAVRQIEWIAPTLDVHARIGPDEERTPGKAAREHVETLIMDLVDEQHAQDAQVRAIWSERMINLDCLHVLQQGGTSVTALTMGGPTGVGDLLERGLTALFFPAIRTDGLWAFEYLTDLAASVRNPQWPGDAPTSPLEQRCDATSNWLRRPMSCNLLPFLGRAILLHYRALAERRMAAIALAIRLYELDHGARPDRLAQLIPDYLPYVPPDPFAADETALRYKPLAEPPVLYSVNSDGVDDDGRFALRSNGTVNWDELDLVFFLNGDRPVPPPPEEKEDAPVPPSPGTQHEDRDRQNGSRDQHQQ